MSGPVTMYVNVVDGSEGGWAGSSGQLWTKTVEMDFLPREGDVVHLAGDYRMEVRLPYWNDDGTAYLEFPKIVRNPQQDGGMAVSPGMIESRYASPWPEMGEPVVEVLTRAGWRKH